MKGQHRGSVTLVEQKIKPPVMKLHCIIHEENLCAKISNSALNDVMSTVTKIVGLLAELGTANLNSIPQPQIPQNCKRCSATANPQVCDRFAVTFRTSAIANAHSTSANLDRNIYCYFVFVMSFFIFEGQILPWTRR